MAPIASLTVRLSAQIAEFQSEFKQASKSAQKFADDFEGTATKAAAVGTFFGTIAADIAKSIASGLASALKDAVRFSSEFNNAFIGLGSIARAFGTDTDLATTAARRLSADGLLPLKDSATGLKNLLASGFNLDQSVQLMNAFKDSAAFGRAGALSFGDAIRTATEGVKNGNSILVDNAGITKNLSNILKEAGFSAQDVGRASSDAGVRMALFNGILKEAAAFTGDAAKLTETYSGAVSRLDSQYTVFLASLGDAITQNQNVAQAIGFVGDEIRNLTGLLGKNGAGFNFVSDAVILFVKALSSILQVVDLVQTGFTALQMVSNRMVGGLLNMGVRVMEVTQAVSKLQMVLDPVNFYKHKAAAEESARALGWMRAAMTGLADSSADSERRSREWGNTIQSGAAKLDGLVKELEAARGKSVTFGESVARVRDAQNGAAAATTKHGDAIARLTALTPEQVQVHNLWVKAKEHEKAAVDFATESWKVWEKTVSTALSNIQRPLKSIDLSGIVPQVDAGGAGNMAGRTFKGPGLLEQMFGTKADVQNYFKSTFGDLSAMLSSAITGSGSIAGALGNYATNVAKDFAATALSFIPGIGPILSQFAGPIIDGLKKAFGSIFGIGTAGRDIVKEFAGSFGGFDALHLKLNELGAEGERLWIMLTQGVGRNNPDQARAAVEAITAALTAQEAKTKEVAAAAAASAAAQQAALDEISAKYKTVIDKLDNEFQSLQASVAKEAAEEVMGIVETQERARMEEIKREREAQEQMRDEEIKTKKEAFDAMLADGADTFEALREIFGRGIDIPYHFSPQNAPPGYTQPRPNTPSYTSPEPGSSSGMSFTQSSSRGTPPLNVTLRMPNNQIILRQFVQGMESEGLA